MKQTVAKVSITLVAVMLIVSRIIWPNISVDSIAIALLVIAVVPWLWELVESAEFPGGWKFHFRELNKEQERQKSEIDALKFLISNFLTEAELNHLKNLARDEPFYFDPSPFFDSELRHLRALGLIDGQPGRGVRSLNRDRGDVKDHFLLTDRGRDYLKLRKQAEEELTGNE